MSTRATTGDVFAALFAAHQAGDYWVQTERQVADKRLPGWRGRLACGRHVASMTAGKVVTLSLLHASGRRVDARRTAAALAADAASHYLADRGRLLKMATVLGRRRNWMRGMPREGRDDNPCMGTGASRMDQAFHVACLWAAALIVTGRPGSQ